MRYGVVKLNFFIKILNKKCKTDKSYWKTKLFEINAKIDHKN